jgi:hypothetical protein
MEIPLVSIYFDNVYRSPRQYGKIASFTFDGRNLDCFYILCQHFFLLFAINEQEELQIKRCIWEVRTTLSCNIGEGYIYVMIPFGLAFLFSLRSLRGWERVAIVRYF